MLLGRGSERAAIDGLIRGAGQGVSGVLLLSGDAGAGKTALLEYAADTTAVVTVVRARGIEAESSLPFAALADVLRPMMAQLDRLPPVQSASLRAALVIGPPLPGDRFTTYVAALNLVALFAETQPLLIIVDDLHWIDPESAEALFFAARRLGAERIAMLFAARDSGDLPAEPAALPVLQLGGLDKDPSLQLLSQATPAIAAPAATAHPRPRSPPHHACPPTGPPCAPPPGPAAPFPPSRLPCRRCSPAAPTRPRRSSSSPRPRPRSRRRSPRPSGAPDGRGDRRRDRGRR